VDGARRLAAFWKSRDPTPTTPVNEAFIQHCYRVLAADALFGGEMADGPGWRTEPGRQLVRFGSPHVDRGGAARRPEAPSADIIWDREFGEGLGFDAAAPGSGDAVDRAIDPAQGLVVLDPGLPSLHTRRIPGGPVAYDQSMTLFSGLRRDVRLSVAVAIPAAVLDPAGGGAGAPGRRHDWSRVEVRWAVFDEDWRTIAERSMCIDAPECVNHDASGRTFLIARAELDLDAGDYVVATGFTDSLTGREGSLRRSVRIEPFTGMLSDIELCRFAFRARESGRRPFRRFDAEVVPNPLAEIVDGEVLGFYFEAYHLARDARGHRRCRLRYVVRSMESALGAGVVNPLTYDSTIDEPASRHDFMMPRIGSIDVERLPAGEYELHVDVEDLIGGRSERRSVSFRRISGTEARAGGGR
jgi:GWxTD domain-containing protein